MLRDFKPEMKTLFLVALVAVVISVGGIFLLRELLSAPAEPTPPVIQQSPPPASQPQSLDTSDLQTYRNKEFGFEFVLPYYDATSSSIIRQSSFNEYVGELSEGFKKVMVAGAPAIQGVEYAGGEADAHFIATYIDFSPKAIIVLSTQTWPEHDEEHRENLQQHEKLVSTFRLIDPNDLSFLEDSLSAWGTYEGYLKLGFSDLKRIDFTVEYPLNWAVNIMRNPDRDVYISTFGDVYIPTSNPDSFPEIYQDQGIATISIRESDLSIDNFFSIGEPVDAVVLERSSISGIGSENRLIRYELPKLGLEGMAMYVEYVVSSQTLKSVKPRYEFRLMYNRADQMKDVYEAVFNHILDTFRFVE